MGSSVWVRSPHLAGLLFGEDEDTYCTDKQFVESIMLRVYVRELVGYIWRVRM